MKNKVKEVTIQTSKITDDQGRVIVATLDDIIKQINKMLLDRNMVVGSAKWRTGYPLLRGMLESAYRVTVELLKRGASDGGMDTDKYQLLTATSKAFGTKNTIINPILSEISEEFQIDQKNRTELDMDEDKDHPLSEEEQAKLIAEPTSDVDTQNTEVTTKSNSKWKVDKINYTITINGRDNNPVVIQLAPAGSWRHSVLAWLSELVGKIKKGVSEGFEYIVDKLGGMKDSFKKSLSKNKPPYWCDRDQTFKTIDTNQPCDKEGNLKEEG